MNLFQKMFYPTKPGSEEFLEDSLHTKKLIHSLYHREVLRERRELGLSDVKNDCDEVQGGKSYINGGIIRLNSLDRFVKRESDEFSLSAGSRGYPPESLLQSESAGDEQDIDIMVEPAVAGQHEQIDNGESAAWIIIESHEIPLEAHRASARKAAEQRISPC